MPTYRDKYGNLFHCSSIPSSGLDYWCSKCITVQGTRTRLKRIRNNVVACPNCGTRTEVDNRLEFVNQEEARKNVSVFKEDKPLPYDEKNEQVPREDRLDLLELRKLFRK